MTVLAPLGFFVQFLAEDVMTVDEFEEQQESLRCKECGRPGLTMERNANNGGVRPVCGGCGSKTPLLGVQWLAQRNFKMPRRGRSDTRDVWAMNGDHCAFCGKSWELCEQLSIGRSKQHVVPFYQGGDDWPLIPFCARCQQASTAALEETRRIEARVKTLQDIIRRMESRNPELRG